MTMTPITILMTKTITMFITIIKDRRRRSYMKNAVPQFLNSEESCCIPPVRGIKKQF